MRFLTAASVRTLLFCLAGTWLALSAAGCSAQQPSEGKQIGSANAKSTTTAAAGIKEMVERKLGTQVDGITDLGFDGLYEVRIGNDIVYTDAKVDHLFVGNILDLNSHVNLTKTRVDALVQASTPAYKFADFPLASAIKVVKGSGKRQVVIFEDPNCGYCKRLEKALADADDLTLYVFLYPVLGPDSTEKAHAIWCSADRSKTWTDWMRSDVAIPAITNEKACKHPIDKIVDLGKKLRVSGTPTLFFPNGKRVPGALEGDELIKSLAENG